MSDGPRLAACSACGARFACDPAGDCWCRLPPYLPVPGKDAACLCPVCLRRAQAAARGTES